MFCALTGEAKGSIANEGKSIVALEIKNPVISIYDTVTLKKKKVLSSSEAGAHEYVSLAFSADGKLVLAQGWKLIFFHPPTLTFPNQCDQNVSILLCKYFNV